MAEPEDQNFIRKHYLALQAQGLRMHLRGCFLAQLVILVRW